MIGSKNGRNSPKILQYPKQGEIKGRGMSRGKDDSPLSRHYSSKCLNGSEK